MNKAVELPNSLPIGTRVAEFEIREVIGEGGFGIVYLAFDHSLQRTVAIKEYMPSALAARANDNTVTVRSKRHAEAFGAGLRSFINEARLLAQFDHPALVKVYRFWESHGTAYMAMRYYEGRTFKSVVRDNPELVNEAWLKRLLQPVLGALEALYAAQILHRDVSPENIMIQPDGQPVLLDFGAARQIVQDMAQSLTVILKPGFAPVEQYADDESMRQGPWTDIYSLSAVMYAAITGKAPPAAVARMLNDPIEPLAISGREGYSNQFLEAIDRGMAVRPEIRPQSIAEFSALLGFDAAAAAAAPAADSSSAPAAADAPAEAAEASAASAASDGAARRSRSRSARSAEKGAPGSAEASASSSPSASSPFDSGRRSSRNKTSSKAGKQAAPVAGSSRPSTNMIAGGLCALALLVIGISWFADGSPVKPAAPEVASAQVVVAGSASGEAPAAAEPASAVAAASVPDADPLAAVAGSSANASASAGAVPVAAPVEQAAPTAAAAAASAPTTGTLSIAVQPWATIYVDGVQKGITPPLKKLTLPLGEHEVRLENPNFPAYVQKINVDARKPVTIKHDFGQ
ncbi:non-specific serine/threonine protein kinase [Duganella sp. CF458]|uniref:serine/threonine-protein kinase n=1 Tax=Duganella sp. CF458 TaxID=1884368 RepID=UPI0008EFF96B|nr:serine/threonine-protein kinase [Duganella sp. CF458]SFG94267.1 non-specific serine/threonine protein kinase [Duganella sp. CF458]